MGKPKKTESDIFQELAHASGGKVLADLPPVKYYIDSGNLAVNYLCSGKFIGGGHPGGRIIEMLGPSQGGKSLWGGHFVRGIQLIDGIPVYLDAENALNPEFIKRASHVDPTKVVRYGPADGIDCLERAFLKIHNVIRKVREKYGPDKHLSFVYDSISVSPSDRELRETLVSEDFTEAEWKKTVGAKEQPGERARICNKEFRKIQSTLEKADTSLLIINQIRQKIGVMYGNPEIGSTASTVLEFYSDVRLRVSAHKKIENKLGRMIGINLKVKNIKNRIFTPYMEAEDIQLYYEKGVNPLSGLIGLLYQIERIESSGKGQWTVKEPWAGGKEVRFKAAKSAILSADILYQCPALVDAKDEQEVKDYLTPFGEAIDQGLADNSEKDITDDEVDSLDVNDL